MTKRVEKANQEEKLAKEEETMKATRSASLHVSKKRGEKAKDDVNSGEETCLEDFKIIKVIDKGSFGKVFLVVNTKN